MENIYFTSDTHIDVLINKLIFLKNFLSKEDLLDLQYLKDLVEDEKITQDEDFVKNNFSIWDWTCYFQEDTQIYEDEHIIEESRRLQNFLEKYTKD